MFELNKDEALADVHLQWGIKIPMRDGVELAATLYTLRSQRAAAPCIVTLTPYVAQMWHEFGVYFASNGYSFLAVDVRGRGNSGGLFRPHLNEAADGHDL